MSTLQTSQVVVSEKSEMRTSGQGFFIFSLAGFSRRAQARRMTGQSSTGVLSSDGQPQFTTTHWSVVLAAARPEAPEAAAALESLCRAYWYPLYAYVRREGHNPADAQDLTQGFFAGLLARSSLLRVAPEKGKFRSFLLASMRHFLSDQRDRVRTVKRGGRAEIISLDAQEAEDRYRLEPIDHLDAERIYERRWAMTLLEQALIRLRDESAAAGKTEFFERLLWVAESPSRNEVIDFAGFVFKQISRVRVYLSAPPLPVWLAPSPA
jgi:DNA-directed RNA polymerase specialized sigma24 family protein